MLVYQDNPVGNWTLLLRKNFLLFPLISIDAGHVRENALHSAKKAFRCKRRDSNVTGFSCFFLRLNTRLTYARNKEMWGTINLNKLGEMTDKRWIWEEGFYQRTNSVLSLCLCLYLYLKVLQA